MIEGTLKEQWLNFLGGRWTRKRPCKPGRYYTADYKGRANYNTIVVYHDPGTQSLRQAGSIRGELWGAFWWSEPIPEMPGVFKTYMRRRKQDGGSR